LKCLKGLILGLVQCLQKTGVKSIKWSKYACSNEFKTTNYV
jgi:hypothetical protein